MYGMKSWKMQVGAARKLRLLSVLLSLIYLIFPLLKGQNATIQFLPTYGEEAFELNKAYFQEGEDSLRFTLLRFYVSDIELLDAGKVVGFAAKQQHLIDVEDANSLTVTLEQQAPLQYDEIRFKLGIDSLTNVSGALGGDLDPTKGMYWAWQSGYINFKLEGSMPHCPTRNHKFQYHLGGYLPPWNACRAITIHVADAKANCMLRLDLKQALSQMNLNEMHTIMRPSAEGVMLSETIAKTFTAIE